MHDILNKTLNFLNDQKINAELFDINCAPVLYFGNIQNAKVATIGLNPSDIEFYDRKGLELEGSKRRFPSLKSLKLQTWDAISKEQWSILESSYQNYFNNTPYFYWFDQLDKLLFETSFSYYFPYSNVVHLDLVPLVTKNKWGNLTFVEQQIILEKFKDIFIDILDASDINVIILNGKSVVNQIQKTFNLSFEIEKMPQIDLCFENRIIAGYIFRGTLLLQNKIVKIIGYNHNIQSSFGIKTEVVNNLSKIIANFINDATKY